MPLDSDYSRSDETEETLIGRKAGRGATEKAREARRAHPLRTLAARIVRVHTDERAWRVGGHGEAFVGWLLGRMPDGWFVINNIPVGEHRADIDHLVIGPGGVFTINTKNLTGKVWIGPHTLLHNGYRTDYLPKATAEARCASRLLTAALGRQVPVRGALAIIADRWSIKEKPSDVHVGNPRGVKRWLLGQPAVLGEHEVIQIVDAAGKPSTWTAKRPPRDVRTPAQVADVPAAPAPGVRVGNACPCGGEVILRTRRSDGKQFLGCSRFPKCRRTWPLPPDAVNR